MSLGCDIEPTEELTVIFKILSEKNSFSKEIGDSLFAVIDEINFQKEKFIIFRKYDEPRRKLMEISRILKSNQFRSKPREIPVVIGDNHYIITQPTDSTFTIKEK